jgi:hypothetical protein
LTLWKEEEEGDNQIDDLWAPELTLWIPLHLKYAV